MSAKTSTLHVRVNSATKSRATTALREIGLSMSDAIRLLLHRIAEDQALPPELKVPNAETRAAMGEGNAIIAAHNARFKT